MGHAIVWRAIFLGLSPTIGDQVEGRTGTVWPQSSSLQFSIAAPFSAREQLF
jgi:hypothetical protein